MVLWRADVSRLSHGRPPAQRYIAFFSRGFATRWTYLALPKRTVARSSSVALAGDDAHRASHADAVEVPGTSHRASSGDPVSDCEYQHHHQHDGNCQNGQQLSERESSRQIPLLPSSLSVRLYAPTLNSARLASACRPTSLWTDVQRAGYRILRISSLCLRQPDHRLHA